MEEKIFEVLKVDTAATAWLVGHCADILNKCQQGKDGRTPYERLRRKQLSGSMLEFGSQVKLKVMDKVSGGVMQERWVEGTWLGRQFTTLENLVARKSDRVVVRTRAVCDLQKPPTVEDLDRIIGHPHAPQGVQRYRRLDVLRPETVPEPEEHLSAAAPDPSRPILRAVYITRAMLERHGYAEGYQTLPCDVDRLSAPVVTLQIAADAWRLLWHKMMSTSSRWSKRTSEKTSTSQKKSNDARRDVEKRVRAQRDAFLVQVIRNFLRAELKVTKKW